MSEVAVKTDGRRTVLVVDDNPVDREHIRRLLGRDYLVLEASTVEKGVEASANNPIDCVLLDHRMPDRDGVDALPEFVDRALPVVMLTAQGNEDLAVEAMKRGATDYLSKAGLDGASLSRAVTSALEHHRLRLEIIRRELELHSAIDELEHRRRELEASNRALAEREAQLHAVLEQLPGLVWTTDVAGVVTSIAGTALHSVRLGPTSWVGRSIADAMPSGDGGMQIEAAHARALTGDAARYSVVWDDKTYECNVQPLHDAMGELLGAIGVGLDVTEAKRLEQRLRQAARLEALGKLSGGVAHDFNNVLTAIVGFARLASARLDKDDKARSDLDQVLRAADRATGLVRQLLSFSRQDGGSAHTIDLRHAIVDVLPMLGRLIGEDLHIEVSDAPDALPVRVDPVRLEQILVNLAVNSRDAMPDGGRIRICTRTIESATHIVGANGERLPPGGYVLLELADDGPGMPPDVIARAFEPFFTTKAVEHGTGLGLSTVYGIVQQCDGLIDLTSELGRGTTFRIYFPQVRLLEDEIGATDPAARPARGNEVVLVVEDEEPVRIVVVRMLESLGYIVHAADGSASALEILRGTDETIDLLLTDVGLPGVSGAELGERALALFPDLAVVYMSGYGDPSLRARRTLPVTTRVLEKPLTLDALARGLRAELDTRDPLRGLRRDSSRRVARDS